MPTYNVPKVQASMPRIVRTPNSPTAAQTAAPKPPTSGQLWPRGDFDK